MRKWYLAFFCFFLFATSYGQFDEVSGDFTINSVKVNPVGKGFAKRINTPAGISEFQLTIPSSSILFQDAAVWNNTRIHLQNNFKVITQLFFGTEDGPGYSNGNAEDPGGDGIKFVFQTISEKRLTLQGGGTLGYWQPGLPLEGFVTGPSFEVEFDTYENFPSPGCIGHPADPQQGPSFSGPGDIPEDHIGFARNGSYCHNLKAPMVLVPSVPGGDIVGQVEDGKWHNVVFEWNATTKIFLVSFDGTTYLLNVDLLADIFTGSGEVFWGFTSATNHARNDQRVRILQVLTTTPLNFQLATRNIKCFGENDGAVTLTANGGTVPYEYVLTGLPGGEETGDFSGNTATIENLPAGSYTVYVRDVNGLAAPPQGFNISQSVFKLNTSVTVTDTKCFNTPTGAIQIQASGGTAPYILTGTGIPEDGVNLPAAGFTRSGLTPGDYSFLVTDANGCVDDIEIEITQPAQLIATSKDNQPACNGSNGSVTISASGGTAPYTGTGIKSGLAPGTHTFTIKDANDCTASVIVTIGGTGPGSFNPATESFPVQFNTGLTRSLYNKTFTGSSGTWTANSNSYGSIGVFKPYYSAYSNYALKIVNVKTGYYNTGSATATSPKVNLAGACCPNNLKLEFTLWSYNCVYGDSKAELNLDFSGDGGNTWSQVWSRTSAQLYNAYGANGKANISVAVPAGFQVANFRYRFSGEMDKGNNNNFYVFIDDIHFDAEAACSTPGSIGDFVWNDLNRNGKQESGEPGLAGVAIKLTLPNNTFVNTVTDNNGKYTFQNLAAGTYKLSFTPPVGFNPSPANVGTDAADSDPENGTVTVVLAAGETKTTVDAGFSVPACTNPKQHHETFPNMFNLTMSTSLSNKTFKGASGIWTANSNSCATVVTVWPFYIPNFTSAVKLVHPKTGKTASSTSVTSPKINITGSCCPAQQELSFVLMPYSVSKYDTKAALHVDFSKDGGLTWTNVWSRTSAAIYSLVGASSGIQKVEIPVTSTFQSVNFRYRFRGTSEKYNSSNFYLFIDDVRIASPESCVDTKRTAEPAITAAPRTLSLAPAAEPIPFNVVASPNPAVSQFRLDITSAVSDPVTVKVMDISGRVVANLPQTKPGQPVIFGGNLSKGTYLAEVAQGFERKIVKLVKL